MKSLVIGDVHNLTNLVDEIINKFGSKYDEIAIVGDYFDSFGDDKSIAEQTAIWLRDRIKEGRLKLILGNHDLHYKFYRNHWIRGTGYSRNKADAINKILSWEDWGKLLFFYETQGFFISHAGLGQHMAHSIEGFSRRNLKASLCEDYYNSLQTGDMSIMFGIGKARGGELERGGITWQDWDQEFRPIKGLNQIVGHTHGNTIRYKNYDGSINICVDCLPNYVLEINDGKLKEIKLYIKAGSEN